jgi:hypothetical protein
MRGNIRVRQYGGHFNRTFSVASLSTLSRFSSSNTLPVDVPLRNEICVSAICHAPWHIGNIALHSKADTQGDAS